MAPNVAGPSPGPRDPDAQNGFFTFLQPSGDCLNESGAKCSLIVLIEAEVGDREREALPRLIDRNSQSIPFVVSLDHKSRARSSHASKRPCAATWKDRVSAPLTLELPAEHLTE
jgi:hypothetical protein